MVLQPADQALCLPVWSSVVSGPSLEWLSTIPISGRIIRGGVSAEVRGGILFSHQQWETVLQDMRGALNHKWLCIFPAVSKQLISHAVSPGVQLTHHELFGKLEVLIHSHPSTSLPPSLWSPSSSCGHFLWKQCLSQAKGNPLFLFYFLLFLLGFFFFSFLFQFCFACVSYTQAVVLLWLRALWDRWWVESAKWGSHRQRTGRREAECGNQQVKAGRGLASLNLCPKIHFTHLFTLIILRAADKPEHWAQNDR